MKSLTSGQKFPELLTLKEACQILKVHPNTLRLWEKKGYVYPVRLGERKQRRYHLRDIKKLITSSSANNLKSPALQSHQFNESLEWFKAIIQSSDDAIIAKTIKGIITSWNPAAERLYGYTAPEIIGKPISILFPPGRKSEFKHFMDRIKKGEGIDHFETVRQRKNGTLVNVSVTISPIKNSSGIVVGASSIARDNTDRIALERHKDAFISVASHELKTPVTTLKGYTQILQRYFKKNKNAISYLSKMDNQIIRLAELVNSLLDVSRIQAGKLPLVKDRFDICILVRGVIEDMQNLSSSHRIYLKRSQSFLVFADRYRISQVLTNLILNSIKYSPNEKQIVVRIIPGKDFVTVAVQDFGIGIHSKHREKIFEMFYQVSTKIRPSYSGFGLGLYISDLIVKNHGGRIWVESEKGKGSTFYFTLKTG